MKNNLNSTLYQGTFLGTFALLMLLTGTGCDNTPKNFVVSAADVPSCTISDNNMFDYIENQTLGVQGFNPEASYIGRFPAERYVNINNWQPRSSYKRTLRGRLYRFNVYDGWGDEMDWNAYVIPAPSFQYLIDDVLPYKGGDGFWCRNDDWHDCGGTDNCLEAEITPDQRFYQNPWFPKSPDDSPLEGKDICFYGPWVSECFHGHRPEIHPSELIWWREKWGDADLFWLMTMLDDSNRFDENSEFDDGGQNFPSNWRPWAKPPLTARFRIPFEVSISSLGNRMSFVIGESFAHNVVSREDPNIRRDADNGKVHVLEYEGKELVTVTEIQQDDDNLGVQFVGLCRTANNKLRGYVQILTRVGRGINDQEGYHVLYVLRSNKPGLQDLNQVPLPEMPLAYWAWPEADKDSIKVVRDADGLNLRGTVKIRMITDDKHRGVIPAITDIRSRDKKLVFTPISGSVNYRLKDIPLFEAAVFEISYADGHQEEVRWPGIGMTPILEAKSVESGESYPLAESLLLKDAKMKSEDRSMALQEVEDPIWIIKALPFYAPFRDGDLSLEEGNPFSKALNQYLQQKPESWSASFGSEQPFQFKWTFDALDLNTGRPVEIQSLSGSVTNSAAIQIEYLQTPLEGSLIQVRFPEKLKSHLLQLVATLEVKDVYGNLSQYAHTLWNRSLQSTEVDKLYTAVKMQLPKWTGQVELASQAVYLEKTGLAFKEDSLPESTDNRRAEQILIAIQHASADGRINLAELRKLQSGVMYWSEAER